MFWVVPPFLPLVGVVCGDGDVAYGGVKPHVEHLHAKKLIKSFDYLVRICPSCYHSIIIILLIIIIGRRQRCHHHHHHHHHHRHHHTWYQK
jgi:hypothetical protein